MSFDLAMLLLYATPVALAAIGETIGQKAGLINIGLEGIMLVGAYFAMTGTRLSGSVWVGIACGVLAGALLASIQAIFTLRLGIDQVVAGTAVNLFSLGLTSTLFRIAFGSSGQLISLPKLTPVLGLDALVWLMLAAIPLVAYLLSRTRWGLALRACGEYPDAAASAGLSVAAFRWQAAILAGAFGALAGVHLCLGITGSFAENYTNGRGFVAIALVTFGRWNPFGVLAAALIVGYAESLQFFLQTKGTRLPFQFFVALPYLISLTVLIFMGRGTLAPQALGQPYRRKN